MTIRSLLLYPLCGLRYPQVLHTYFSGYTKTIGLELDFRVEAQNLIQVPCPPTTSLLQYTRLVYRDHG